MIAPLGTLAFLATLWLLVVVGAAILEESGARIVAALRASQCAERRLPFRRRGFGRGFADRALVHVACRCAALSRDAAVQPRELRTSQAAARHRGCARIAFLVLKRGRMRTATASGG